jgi:hypothetical protein
MAVFGVAFLVAVVLLGIYGLRVRVARLNQAENAIAGLEDALRQTGAAIGRVETDIAVITDAVKASLRPREPAKPPRKARLFSPLRDALLHEQAGPLLRYCVGGAAVAAASQPLAIRRSDWEHLQGVLFRHASQHHHGEVLLPDVSDQYCEWKAASKLIATFRLAAKTPKGYRYSTVHPGQAPYYDAGWSALTRLAPCP